MNTMIYNDTRKTVDVNSSIQINTAEQMLMDGDVKDDANGDANGDVKGETSGALTASMIALNQ